MPRAASCVTSLIYHESPCKVLAVCVDEPALRHVVIGRTNWLVFGSQRGGEAGARPVRSFVSALAQVRPQDAPHPACDLTPVSRW